MQTKKIHEIHKVTLDDPIQWVYDPVVIEAEAEYQLLTAIEEIQGVLDVYIDPSDPRSFFVKIEAKYYFEDIKKLIRTLTNAD